MKQKQKNLINWLAVFLWLGVIYYFSNQPDLKSELEPIWDLVCRKLAHLAEYFVLVYLLFQAISGHKVKWSKALILSIILAILYAATDEWHQSFIQGRSASLVDVGVDSIGALTMGVLLYKNKEIKK